MALCQMLGWVEQPTFSNKPFTFYHIFVYFTDYIPLTQKKATTQFKCHN